ncbi:MAG: hypothetical protein ACRD08_01265, partial [Acidimicrobiales bacterium]
MSGPFRPSFGGLALLGGTLLLAAAGLFHPVLVGDGAAQLGLIAATPAWRTIHLMLLLGIALVVAGLSGVAGRHVTGTGEQPARAALVLAVLGYGALAANVAFMTGAGTALASAYARGDSGITATQAVFVFDMLHPVGLVAQRFGAFVVGLSTSALGWAVVNVRVFPRTLGWVGVASGVIGVLAALGWNENARQVLAGVVLATVWQV